MLEDLRGCEASMYFIATDDSCHAHGSIPWPDPVRPCAEPGAAVPDVFPSDCLFCLFFDTRTRRPRLRLPCCAGSNSAPAMTNHFASHKKGRGGGGGVWQQSLHLRFGLSLSVLHLPVGEAWPV